MLFDLSTYLLINAYDHEKDAASEDTEKMITADDFDDQEMTTACGDVSVPRDNENIETFQISADLKKNARTIIDCNSKKEVPTIDPDKEGTTVYENVMISGDDEEKQSASHGVEAAELKMMNIRNNLSNKNWVKLCRLKKAQSTGLNRMNFLVHLVDAPEGSPDLQPPLSLCV